MWGADEVYKTALFGSSYNSKGVSGYTDVSFDATNDGFTVNVANFNNNNNGWSLIKCGGKKGAYTGTIITAAAIDKAITKVVLTIDAITASNVTSMTLFTRTNTSEWTSAGTFDKTTGSKTVELATPTANLYYKIEIVCTQGSSNGLVTVSKVEYYKAQEVAAGVTAQPSISGDTPFLDNTTVTITNDAAADGATIYYTTDGTDPTTSSSVFTAPFSVNATTTVKAAAKKGEDELSAVTEMTFTKVATITVAEAIAATPASGTSDNVYIHGIVSAFYNTSIVGDGANYRYYISDDGTTTGQLLVYKGKGLNNVAFSSADDLQLGDEVVVVGGLTTYNGTKEVAQNNYILSLVRKPSPELAWSAASYTATYGESITYPTLTNPNSVTVAYSSSDTNVATIDPSTGEITIKANGETVITASFAGDATYRAQDVTYTLTVAGMKLSPGFSFAEAEVNMTYDEDYTGQALTNPNSLGVTYESSNTDVADVDENTGELALYKAGTVTIIANYAGDATYASGSASYTINVTKAAAGLAFASDGPFVVAPGADFDVPAFTNPHSLTVVWSSSDEDVAIADAASAVIGSKTGTAVITASFAGDDRYNASEVSYTIVVTNDIEVTWDLSKDQTATATEDEMTWTNANVTMEAAKADATTPANNYYPGTSGKTYTSTRFYKNSTLTITPLNGFAIKSVVFTATSDGYATALAGSTWTNATAVASSKTVTITPNDGTNAISAVIGGTTGHSSVVINLGKSFDVKLNSAGFATFAAPAPLDYSDDSEFSAWQITDANSSTGVITFSQITGAVAAGTGVLLMGTPSATISVPVVTSGSDISATNMLVGFTTATDVAADTYYGLSGDEFVKVNAGTVPAGKALLPVSSVDVKAFTFVFEDATGIESIQNSKSEIQNTIFDLSGRRVVKPTKGLYIVNGKKIVK